MGTSQRTQRRAVTESDAIGTYPRAESGDNRDVDEPTEAQIRSASDLVGEILTVTRDRRAAAVLHRVTEPDLPELCISMFFRDDDGDWVDMGGGSVSGGAGSLTIESYDGEGSITVEHGGESERWLRVTWTPPDEGSSGDREPRTPLTPMGHLRAEVPPDE